MFTHHSLWFLLQHGYVGYYKLWCSDGCFQIFALHLSKLSTQARSAFIGSQKSQLNRLSFPGLFPVHSFIGTTSLILNSRNGILFQFLSLTLGNQEN